MQLSVSGKHIDVGDALRGHVATSITPVVDRYFGSAIEAITAQKGRDIPASVWGIAVCYCVDRAPGHRFGRLAYALEQAREHAALMKEYSASDLRAILRHSLGVIERARASGRWTLDEGAEE